MKKLLLGALLLLSMVLFGQDSPFYVRAEAFQMGSKGVDSKVTWDDSTYRSCNVFIKLDNSNVTIFSKVNQQYHVISYDGKMDNGANRWYCSDSLGRTCNIYLMNIKNSPGYLSLTVEFSDLVWFYICEPIK